MRLKTPIKSISLDFRTVHSILHIHKRMLRAWYYTNELSPTFAKRTFYLTANINHTKASMPTATLQQNKTGKKPSSKLSILLIPDHLKPQKQFSNNFTSNIHITTENIMEEACSKLLKTWKITKPRTPDTFKNTHVSSLFYPSLISPPTGSKNSQRQAF